jgi:hypothetical protein
MIARKMLTFFLGLACIYLSLCAVLFFTQRSLIYFPQPRTHDAGATLTLPVDGAEVMVTTRPHAGPHAVIYFGGNAEDVSYALPELSAAFADHALYLMHYRGYGGSTGTPTEQTIHQDAQALFDWVHAKHPQVVVMGRSLGSGVAIRLASERPAARLVLITPYSSLMELGARQFPYLPVRWLMQDKYESWRYAPKITLPTLLVAAEHDEIIPRASTEDLYSRFTPGVASLQVIPGVGHNTISANPLYFLSLRSGAGL